MGKLPLEYEALRPVWLAPLEGYQSIGALPLDVHPGGIFSFPGMQITRIDVD